MTNDLQANTTPQTVEQELAQRGAALVAQAKAVIITNDEEYAQAAEFARDIKGQGKKVSEFWEGLKKPAYEAYKTIQQREKSMVAIYDDAEFALKVAMTTYTAAKEAERRRIEEETRRRQQEERDRLLAEAMAAEAAGNKVEAEAVLAMAEVVEDIRPAAMTQAAPKVDGISYRTTWKARIIDRAAVPVMFAGMELRPVDESCINKLAATSSGTIQIPGVEFYSEQTAIIRSK